MKHKNCASIVIKPYYIYIINNIREKSLVGGVSLQVSVGNATKIHFFLLILIIVVSHQFKF